MSLLMNEVPTWAASCSEPIFCRTDLNEDASLNNKILPSSYQSLSILNNLIS